MIVTDSRTAEKIASSVITQKVSSPQGTIRLSRESGKALTITPGPSRAQCISKTSLTTLEMVQVQINTGLSNKKMQELAVTLNKAKIQKLLKKNLGKILQWLVKKLKVYSKFPKSHLQGHQQKLIIWQRLFTARVYRILLTQFPELDPPPSN